MATPEEITESQARRAAGSGEAQGHAVLAKVTYRYPAGATSIILFVKPALTGDEPLDVLQYGNANKEFPNQSTGDHFFDEAQWESYRKLGEHSGDSVFHNPVDSLWLMSLPPLVLAQPPDRQADQSPRVSSALPLGILTRV